MKNYKSLYTILIICIFIAIFLGIHLGYKTISIYDIYVAILHPTITNIPQSSASDIIWNLRLPRVILSLAIGMGLSLSGVVMQAIFRNPMSSPYIGGISSGAALGVVLAIFIGLDRFFGAFSVGIMACLGAIFTSLVLVLVTKKIKHNTSFILLVGIALGFTCSSISSILIYAGGNNTGMDISLYWMMGSVAFTSLTAALLTLLLTIIITLYFLRNARALNLLLIGEASAITLGRYIPKDIQKFFIINAILVGILVMQAGLVGFVGLIIPHLARMICGGNHKVLIPTAVLSGGLITIFADIIGRTIIPGADIPIGVILDIIGGPVFIWILISKKYRYGGEL